MKYQPNQDYREKLATVRLLVNRSKLRNPLTPRPAPPPAVPPLTEEQRQQADAATRYERRINMVFIKGGARVSTPFHKACQ